MRRWFLLIALLSHTVVVANPDFEREARLRAQIEDAIIDGEPMDLTANGWDFLAIYTEADEPKGAVLILHGRGFHPDWVDVIAPLRVDLVASGWNTLSIQMPVLDKAAKYFDYVPIFQNAYPRIEAALAFLRDQGNQKLVVLAHSCGYHMLNSWLHAEPSAASQFDALIGVGMGATDYQQPMVETFALDKFKGPILDLYASEDFPAVKRLAPERKAQIAQNANPLSAQIVVQGADHYYHDSPEPLVEAVAAWLETLE